MSVLVVGATGAVGRHVVAELAARGARVRAATRDPARAAAQLGGAVEAVALDLERPETFAPALTGVAQVFLVARPGDDHADRLAIPFLDEARRCGVRHVVDLSAMGVEALGHATALRRTELHLEASGMAFTHLRPNWFFQVFTGGPLHASIVATGSFFLPAAEARISYIDVRDIAAVAAVALTAPGHEGQAYTLTGGAALDHATVAAALSAAAGRTVRYVPVDEEAARRALLGAGLSAERVERLVGFYRLVRAGACAPVSPAVATVLGRPPVSLERFAVENAAAWRAAA